MKESISGVAPLEDVEVETFIAFCEYAYTGAYMTPDITIEPRPEDKSHAEPNDDNDRPNGLSNEYDEGIPVQEASDNKEYWEEAAYCASVVAPEQTIVVYPYERLWNEFRSLRFDCAPASFSQNPDILFHAKLYVFATRYLIEPLRQQSLKSLHRDLCNFSLNRENTSHILGLLDFTYAHTGRGEPGGKSSLRELVIHYTACEARTLGDDDRLMKLLDANAELGSDLVAKLVK